MKEKRVAPGITGNVKQWYTSNNDLVVERGKRLKPNENCIDLEGICELFLETHRDLEIPITLARLCLFLNMEKRKFLDIANSEDERVNTSRWSLKEYKAMLFRRMLMEIEAGRMEGCLSGKEKSTIAMLELKNLFPDHYKEKIEVKTENSFNVLSIAKLLERIESGEEVIDEAKKPEEIEEEGDE